MTSQSRIRVATPADAADIARLHAENWRVTYRGAYSDAFLDGDVFTNRQQVWAGRFDNPKPNQAVFVAEDETGLVGFVCAFGAHDPEWGTLIDNLHVAPALRGHGLGNQLMQRAFDWARATHPDVRVYLWVLFNNTNAMKFYQHIGARDAGRDTIRAPDGAPVDAHRYVWDTIP